MHHGYVAKQKMKVLETTHQVTIPFGFKAKYVKHWLASVPDDAEIVDWEFNDDENNQLVISFKERQEESP